MAKFEFKNNAVELEINGQNFSVELTNDVILACDRLKDGAGNFVEALSGAQNTEDAKERLTETCDFLAKGIDNILGEGSAKKIFETATVTLLNLTDIIFFIRTEIISSIKAKTIEYGGTE